MDLRRWIAFIVCMVLFCIPVEAKPEPQYVVLTFDDGPSGQFTQQLLSGLEERQVKATFLLCGYRIKEYPQMTQDMYDAGHEIGLHGYSHKNMAAMSEADIVKELDKTLQLLPDGCEPAFLRAPGGATTRAIKNAAHQTGLAILNWSVDPRDWATHDAVAVEQAVIGDVQNGDVILLHDMCSSSVEAALAIVDALLARGFQFVTASQLAALRGTEPEAGMVYKRFR